MLPDSIEGICSNYNDVLAYREPERRTGVHVEFRHPPSSSAQDKEQLALIIASRDLPGVIEADWRNVLPGGLPEAYTEGLIVKPDGFLARFAPHFG